MNSKKLFTSLKNSRLLTALLFCFCILAFYGCNKNDDLEEEARLREEAYDRQLAADTVIIKNYIATNNITNAKRAPSNSGLYYAVQTPGTGIKAIVGKEVVTHYTLRNLEGDTLDTSHNPRPGKTVAEPLIFRLGYSNLIFGYQESVSLMQVGEKTTFFLPSGLAYGTVAQEKIPANSVLIFDIELLQVKE